MIRDGLAMMSSDTEQHSSPNLSRPTTPGASIIDIMLTTACSAVGSRQGMSNLTMAHSRASCRLIKLRASHGRCRQSTCYRELLPGHTRGCDHILDSTSVVSFRQILARRWRASTRIPKSLHGRRSGAVADQRGVHRAPGGRAASTGAGRAMGLGRSTARAPAPPPIDARRGSRPQTRPPPGALPAPASEKAGGGAMRGLRGACARGDRQPPTFPGDRGPRQWEGGMNNFRCRTDITEEHLSHS